MARKKILSLANDFDNVVAFLQERGILPDALSAATSENARRIHRATYSLILWRFRLKKIPEHGAAFIEEVASDALQILPQVLMGYSKTAMLLMRGILENTLRHVYFSDHPVEFAIMNLEEKWFMSMEQLLDYARAYPDFRKTEPKFDALARMKNLYTDLSAGVHGRRVADLEMRTALARIVYEEQPGARLASFVERCAEVSNFILTIFQRAKFHGFEAEDRRIILRTMDSRARAFWRESDS
jgi:hypothetical protein